MKVKVIKEHGDIPIGVILEVKKCECGECYYDNESQMGYYKLIQPTERKKYGCTEIEHQKVQVIRSGINHLPKWL